MIYSTGFYRDIARRLANHREPMLRHKIAAAFACLAAICFPILIFGILCKIFPQTENIFDLRYGGIVFSIGCILSMFTWISVCLRLRKWYIALILSLIIMIFAAWAFYITNQASWS